MRVKKKYQLRDYKLIQYIILQTNITRTVWQTARRISDEILGVKGLSKGKDLQHAKKWTLGWIIYNVQDGVYFSIEMHVLRFENKLNEEVCSGFIFANLFNSLYISMRLWWNILMANLATNFQDLVAKVKNVVTLAPVLGAIWRPLKCYK